MDMKNDGVFPSGSGGAIGATRGVRNAPDKDVFASAGDGDRADGRFLGHVETAGVEHLRRIVRHDRLKDDAEAKRLSRRDGHQTTGTDQSRRRIFPRGAAYVIDEVFVSLMPSLEGDQMDRIHGVEVDEVVILARNRCRIRVNGCILVKNMTLVTAARNKRSGEECCEVAHDHHLSEVLSWTVVALPGHQYT